MLRVLAFIIAGLAFAKAQGSSDDIPLNLTTSEWITSSTNDEVVAGIVHLNLDSIFLDPNGSPDVDGNTTNKRPKFERFQFFIVVSPSEECAEGINILNSWSLTLLRNSDIEESQDQDLYFIQIGEDWYSNNAGFLYGYDESRCRSRNFSGQIVVDPDRVDEVVRARPRRN